MPCKNCDALRARVGELEKRPQWIPPESLLANELALAHTRIAELEAARDYCLNEHKTDGANLWRYLRARIAELEAKVLVYESNSNTVYSAGKSFMRSQLEPRIAELKRERDKEHDDAVAIALEHATTLERLAAVEAERDALYAERHAFLKQESASRASLAHATAALKWYADPRLGTDYGGRARDALKAMREGK